MKRQILSIIAIYIFSSFMAESFGQEEGLMNLSLKELMEVKITTAGKQEQQINDVPASVVLITKSEIEKFGYQSVEEILSNIPGFYLIDDYSWLGQKNFGVRGFFSAGQFDNVCVLINGISQKSDGLLDSYPTERIEVPVEAIERVEVIRGPMSVMYGSGAFFGAINIITASSDSAAAKDKFSVSAGNMDNIRLFAKLNGGENDFRYSLTGSFYNDGGIDRSLSEMMSDASIVTQPFEEGGWNLPDDRTKGKLQTNRRYFNLNMKYKNLIVDAGLLFSRKNVVETILSAGDGSWVNYNNAHFSVSYSKALSDNFSIEGKFGYFNDYHWVDNNFYFKDSYTNNLDRANSYEAEVIAKIKLNKDISIIAGIYHRSLFDFIIEADYVGLGYLPNLEVIYKDDIINNAVYTQLDYNLSDNLKLVGGLRLERLNNYKFDLNLNFPDSSSLGINVPPQVIPGEFKSEKSFEIIPRLALLYSFNENHTIKLLYGKAIKQPNPTANLDVAINNSPQLKPAEIETFEANYSCIITPQFISNISLFHNSLRNLISRLNLLTDEQSIIISSNAGKIRTLGLELGFQVRPINSLKLDLSITYQNSKDLREGFENIELGYAPKILGYGKICYDISDDITLAVSGLFVGSMYAGWDMKNVDINMNPIIDPDDPLKGRYGYKSGSYFTVDPNVRVKNIFVNGSYLDVKISNLFDHNIYYPTTTSNPVFDKGTLGRGRSFLMTIGAEL